MGIVTVYLDCSDPEARKAQVEQMTRFLSPKQEVTTVIAGDFNFVTDRYDRWDKNTGQFTGYGQTSEALHWHRTAVSLGQVTELLQDDTPMSVVTDVD